MFSRCYRSICVPEECYLLVGRLSDGRGNKGLEGLNDIFLSEIIGISEILCKSIAGSF